MLEVTPKLHGDYGEEIRCREEAARWREAFYKLRDEHRNECAQSTGGGIVGGSQVAPAEFEKLRAKVWRARADVEKLRSEVKVARIAKLALRRAIRAV